MNIDFRAHATDEGVFYNVSLSESDKQVQAFFPERDAEKRKHFLQCLLLISESLAKLFKQINEP